VQKVHTCVLLLDICQFPSWGLHSQAFSLAVCESFCLPTAAPTDGIATISNFYQSYMWWILCQCLSFSSVILSDWLISCSVFWQYWLWTQGFTFAMQELYHMSYSASLSFVLVMFEISSGPFELTPSIGDRHTSLCRAIGWNGVSRAFCQGWPWTTQVARIIAVMSQHAWLVLHFFLRTIFLWTIFISCVCVWISFFFLIFKIRFLAFCALILRVIYMLLTYIWNSINTLIVVYVVHIFSWFSVVLWLPCSFF
jgi:hypothetical protein